MVSVQFLLCYLLYNLILRALIGYKTCHLFSFLLERYWQHFLFMHWLGQEPSRIGIQDEISAVWGNFIGLCGYMLDSCSRFSFSVETTSASVTHMRSPSIMKMKRLAFLVELQFERAHYNWTRWTCVNGASKQFIYVRQQFHFPEMVGFCWDAAWFG